jgi:hypothetical protein
MLAHLGAPNQLFHTPAGTAFADIPVNDPPGNLAHTQQSVSQLVAAVPLRSNGEAASPAIVRSALDLLEARAQFDSPERAIHIRAAAHAGRIYLDLADEHWRAVEIGPDGWQVIGAPPVRFRRPAGMLPLPVPERGGEALNSFLNLPSRNDLCLDCRLVVGGLAIRRALSAAGDIGRAGLG